MAKEQTGQAVSQGVNFMELLFLLFLGLKLGGAINWSWWWVFAPLWGPIALLTVVAGILLIVAAIVEKPKKK